MKSISDKELEIELWEILYNTAHLLVQKFDYRWLKIVVNGKGRILDMNQLA